MPRFILPLTICAILASCQNMGVEPVLGPHAFTDKTVYRIGEPIAITIASDNPEISISDCFDGPAFYLDFLVSFEWTVWSDHVTPCLCSQFPRIHYIGPDNVYLQTIVLSSDYPGTYRLRIPYRYRLNKPEAAEVVTNTFVIQE